MAGSVNQNRRYRSGCSSTFTPKAMLWIGSDRQRYRSFSPVVVGCGCRRLTMTNVGGTLVTGSATTGVRRVLVPLGLAQFICSFAGSNMNVMITDISKDLHTTVYGVQTAITVFLLVMAALMIPGGKLTERYGRVRMFRLGWWSTPLARC